MIKKIIIVILLIWLWTSTGHADAAKDIMHQVLDRDDGTTEVGRMKLSTCAVAKKGNKIICSATPRVKVMDMIRKDYGQKEKDHKTVMSNISFIFMAVFISTLADAGYW